MCQTASFSRRAAASDPDRLLALIILREPPGVESVRSRLRDPSAPALRECAGARFLVVFNAQRNPEARRDPYASTGMETSDGQGAPLAALFPHLALRRRGYRHRAGARGQVALGPAHHGSIPLPAV